MSVCACARARACLRACVRVCVCVCVCSRARTRVSACVNLCVREYACMCVGARACDRVLDSLTFVSRLMPVIVAALIPATDRWLSSFTTNSCTQEAVWCTQCLNRGRKITLPDNQPVFQAREIRGCRHKPCNHETPGIRNSARCTCKT